MKRVLVVEDEPDICEAIRETIEEEGIKADGAFTGIEALEKCRLEEYDAIFLDIRMPGMDGIEVARRLRSDERTHAIPLVFCSVLDRVETIFDGFDVGGNAYVVKPVNRDGILNVVRLIEEESRAA
jgi:DNA-binding response OmpR family regulator